MDVLLLCQFRCNFCNQAITLKCPAQGQMSNRDFSTVMTVASSRLVLHSQLEIDACCDLEGARATRAKHLTDSTGWSAEPRTQQIPAPSGKVAYVL